MHRSQPFARAILMMASLAAITQATQANTVTRQAQIEQLGPYVSRGKGEGRSNRSAPGADMVSHRAAMKRRNVLRHRKACRA